MMKNLATSWTATRAKKAVCRVSRNVLATWKKETEMLSNCDKRRDHMRRVVQSGIFEAHIANVVINIGLR